MITKWTGQELILDFGHRKVRLNTEETKQFEQWGLKRVEKC